MSVIVTRAGKGGTLSWVEADANFTNLNNDKLEAGTPATNIAVTPTGGILATDVQAALAELDTELSGTVTKTASTGAAVIPTGTTANRPGVPTEGHFRRNSELGQWEGYDGAQWNDVGGVSLTATQTLTNKTLTTPNIETSFNYTGSSGIIKVNGINRVIIGSQGIEAGSFKPGAIADNDFADGALIENSVNGIGYGIGAGGTVTQATSKSTAVTLNKPCGQITMNAASLAAGAAAAFVLNNSVVSADNGDTIIANADRINYFVYARVTGSGTVNIVLTNTSQSALADAVRINFVVIKGATS